MYRILDQIKSNPKKPIKTFSKIFFLIKFIFSSDNSKNITNIFYENGLKYEGFAKKCVENGKGSLYKINIFKTYEGEFKDGKYHGKGTFYWNDGAKYTGDWESDTKHGRGILIMPNGEKYDGDFFNQTITGQGTYYYKDGKKFIGEWKDGEKDGDGCDYFSDGEIQFKGLYKNDKRCGLGILYDRKTFKTYEGQFSEGIPVAFNRFSINK